MNFKLLVISILGAFALTSAAYAGNNTKPVNAWTCEDFLAVDDSFQPLAVGFAEALNSKDKPEDAILDIDGIAKITPMVIQSCKENNTLSFKDKVLSEWGKIKKDM